MIKTPIKLQDLRRKIYIKAKSEKEWRFWGLYAYVCKIETLSKAYKLAKQNKGAVGIDGVTFEILETAEVKQFLEDIQAELKAKPSIQRGKRSKQFPKITEPECYRYPLSKIES